MGGAGWRRKGKLIFWIQNSIVVRMLANLIMSQISLLLVTIVNRFTAVVQLLLASLDYSGKLYFKSGVVLMQLLPYRHVRRKSRVRTPVLTTCHRHVRFPAYRFVKIFIVTEEKTKIYESQWLVKFFCFVHWISAVLETTHTVVLCSMFSL